MAARTTPVVYRGPELEVLIKDNSEGHRTLYVTNLVTTQGFSVRFPKGLTMFYLKAETRFVFQYTGPNKKQSINSIILSKAIKPELLLPHFLKHLEKVFDRTTRLYDLNLFYSYGGLNYGEGSKTGFIHPRSKCNKVDYYDPILKETIYLTTKDNPDRVKIELAKSQEIKARLSKYIVTHRLILKSIKFTGGFDMRVVTFHVLKEDMKVLTVTKYVPLTVKGVLYTGSKNSTSLAMHKSLPLCKSLKGVDLKPIGLFIEDSLNLMNGYEGRMNEVNLTRKLEPSLECTFTISKL